MKTGDLRKLFTEYFKEKGHALVSSSSLVPANDPTLLFTNAGMVQFKEVFLGREEKPYSKALSIQKCVRASGKHNDLEWVGYTARHHTFFEMMGNFSFGDYFKKEAIFYAWDFLTNVLNIPKEKFWITVHESDKESEEIWLNEIGVNPSCFSKCGDKDNFWQMGDTGPCGPNTEIFYDHGPEIPGGPPGSPEADGDRYVEIWNLVFMQYERDQSGNLSPLPKQSVDTGMGLERIAAVMQGVHSNYDIELFQHLIKASSKMTDCNDLENPALKVISDHIRSSSFLIVDGVTPSNEGRGYVLRHIIRRAISHGHMIGTKKLFFYKMLSPLIEVMGEAYPELIKSQKLIEGTLKREEEQFAKTLSQGFKLLKEDIQKLSTKTLSGETVFKLYDTYGFPPELTKMIVEKEGLSIDEKGFEREMNKQKVQSQSSSQFKGTYDDFYLDLVTEFTGYNENTNEAVVEKLFLDHQEVESLNAKDAGYVVLNRTPFYAESGGQIGDKGRIQFKEGEFTVTNTLKIGGAHVHLGRLMNGTLHLGDKVVAKINIAARQATVLNHSATHLLHAALREVLGEHVVQKGSYVNPDRLRFDFSHFQPLTSSELRRVEDRVNEQIRDNLLVDKEEMSIEEAKASGAMALFNEKYGDKVRVIKMGDYSKELCGGTHVNRTGDIGLFKIIGETGIAAGIRRIEAITGETAIVEVHQTKDTLDNISNLLKTKEFLVLERLEQLITEDKICKKRCAELTKEMFKYQVEGLIASSKKINNFNVLAKQVEDDVDSKNLRNMLDLLRDKLDKGVVVLASVINQENVNLVAGVTKNCIGRFHADELVKMVAEKIGGKGGGRSDTAQGGGNQIDMVSVALSEVDDWVKVRSKL